MLRSRSGSAARTTNQVLRPLARAQKLETLYASLLLPVSPLDIPLTMVRFIAVAGVGTKQADEWTDDTGNMWMTGIQAPGIGLFSYDHDIGRSDLAMWRNLLDHGQRLLQAVITLVENQQVILSHVTQSLCWLTLV